MLRTQSDTNDELDLDPIARHQRKESTGIERERIEVWIGNMTELLERLRESAIKTAGK